MRDNPLLGTWRLVSWENRDAAGQVTYPLGPDAIGYLGYSADGYMFAHLMAANRPPLATKNAFGGEDGEVAAAARSQMSYCGAYQIEGARIVHRVELSAFPNWIGGEQVRFYAFEDGKLILTAPGFKTKKGAMTTRLVWERTQPGNGRKG